MSENILFEKRFDNVIYQVLEGKVGVITLNRPEKMNPFSWAQLADLEAAINMGETDNRVSIMILKGAGRCFSGGHDLSATMGDAPLHKGEKTWDEYLHSHDRWGIGTSVWDSRAHVQGHIEYCMKIWRAFKPIIAQVHGPCLAGASAIALSCDLLIAGEDARLGYPPARSMSTGDEIMIYSFHVGLKKAKELSLTGDSLTAEEMLEYGMANYVFPNDRLEEETLKIARRIAHVDMELLSLSKRLVNRTWDMMGYSNAMYGCSEFDSLGHFSDSNQRWKSEVAEKGMWEALKTRDEPFGGVLGRYPAPLDHSSRRAPDTEAEKD